MKNRVVDWVNAHGPGILDRMYEMLPLMAGLMLAVILLVYCDEWVWSRLRAMLNRSGPRRGVR